MASWPDSWAALGSGFEKLVCLLANIMLAAELASLGLKWLPLHNHLFTARYNCTALPQKRIAPKGKRKPALATALLHSAAVQTSGEHRDTVVQQPAPLRSLQ